MEPRWRAVRRDVTRVLARHRRLLAAAVTGLAVLSALSVLRPPPPPTDAVAVAARDVPSGARLVADDVASVALPTGVVPDGAYSPDEVPLGRLVAGPLRRGEPLTDARLVGPGLATSLPAGEVLMVVEVSTATAQMVRAGDEVDALAGDSVVAAGASVVSVPRGDSGQGAVEGRAVVLAVDADAALSLSRAALSAPIQVLVRPG